MVERVTSETETILVKLAETIGSQLLLPSVPMDTKIREASHRGLSIWEYAPEARGAIGYKNGATSQSQNSAGLSGGYLHAAEIIEPIFRS